MAKVPYLTELKAERRWSYRRRVPKHLQAVIGREMWDQRLSATTSLRAIEEWATAHRQVEEKISWANMMLRAGITQPSTHGIGHPSQSAPSLPSIVNPQDCYDALERWEQAQIWQAYMEISHSLVDTNPMSEAASRRGNLISQLERYRGYEAIEDFDQRLVDALATEGIALSPNHPVVRILRHTFSAAWVAVERFRSRMMSNPLAVEPPRNPSVQPQPQAASMLLNATDLAPNGEPFVTINSLVENYISDRKHPKKTAGKLRMLARYLNDLTGKDTPINEVTKSLLMELKLRARHLPARPRQNEKAMGFVALADHMNGLGDKRPKITDQTLENWFNLLGGCFNWAIDHDLIAANPTTSIKPRPKKQAAKTRDQFTSDDLRRIFAEPVRQRPSQFWLPLIAAYSGARLNEIGQLTRRDVESERIPHFKITDQTDEQGVIKRLKTHSSRREVPIHPKILEAGFLDFVQAGTHRYVFDDLPHPESEEDYEPTKAFSQWFGRYLTRAGVKTPRKSFHSFRHTFVTRALACQVPAKIVSILVGHETDPALMALMGSAMTERYAERPDLEVLAQQIRKLNYGDLYIHHWADMSRDAVFPAVQTHIT